jgi:hypothetical protein
MASASDVLVHPIIGDDIQRVARFLNESMNSRLSAAEWANAMVPPWSVDSPNHGFMLISGNEVVGANLAFYSLRMINGHAERLCNLGALSVREDMRSHTFRLIRAILNQRGYSYTDLSPSGNVVELDRRLGFQPLDTSTALTVNLPWPSDRVTRVISDLDQIDGLLTGDDQQIFQDHRQAMAVRHLLVVRGPDQCYIIFRKDRRKRLRIFASILYVGNKDLYPLVTRHVARHLLLRYGAPARFGELRVIGSKPTSAYVLGRPRPKMFKSSRLQETDIDYLYSELTCVPW